MGIRVRGTTELIAEFTHAEVTAGAKAVAATSKTAHDIERDAKVMSPVDTGNLRSSIGTSIAGSPSTGTVSAEIGPTAHYGLYVEAGTSRMAAQPYLYPAADRHLETWYRVMERLGEL